MTLTDRRPSPGFPARIGRHGDRSARENRSGWWPLAALAAVCYVPLLFTAPGRVGADTKTYLYLDPGRLLSRAVSMWDPNVGLGTVTHQNIGYLFPMGPWFWLFERAGAPDWVAQRLWLGSILFAAGAGVWFLLRRLRLPAPAVTVAMFAYALTPYTLTLASRLSVILLPFAGLPWLVAFTMGSLHRGGWREPARFALVVLAIGGVNATALVFAGVGPLLWVAHELVARTVTFGRALAACARIGVLSVAVSLWWIAGLAVQGAYGIDILRYTETAETVASASVAPEVLRSLGYWFFYGGDRLGPWIEPGAEYTQRLWLLAVTYLLPVLALAAGALTRWRHRSYFVALAAAGTFIAVGAQPWDGGSLASEAWKAVLLSDRGLALRSTPRAVPLLALGFAALLGSGVAALASRARRAERPVAAGLVALTMLAMPPLFTGDMVAANLERPDDLPAYWEDAARYVDARGDGTRVLEIPGADFASYRWGNTVDPITPGLIDRPYVARELIPYGTPPAADLLNAFDRRIQENVLEPEAIAPIARLMGAGDVVVRNDIQYERFRLARPYAVASLVERAPGLGPPRGFGEPRVNEAVTAAGMTDELALAMRESTEPLPPVQVAAVERPVPIVRAKPDRPVVVAGDGEGIVSLAAAGLVDGSELILYSAAIGDVPDGAPVVLTDSNRRRGRRWISIRENAGYTERAGEQPIDDLSDNRLPVFGDVPGDPDTQSVAEVSGGVVTVASSYGNPTTFTPEYRPAMAVDGDPATVWRTGPNRDVRGERLTLHFDPPVTTATVRLAQLPPGSANRSITEVDLVFDGGERRLRARLDERSTTPEGQAVDFPERTFTRLDVVIVDESSGRRDRALRPARFTGLDSVGFAEVDVGGRRAREVIRLPLDAPTGVGHPLTVVLERQRTDPAERVRHDEEPAMARTFTLADARSFALGGTARLSDRAPDDVIDRLLAPTRATVATSSRRLPGSPASRGSSALDGDPSTAWVGAFGAAEDWIEATSPVPVTFDRLDLRVLADGRHSVPRRLRIEADGAIVTSVAVPAPAGPGVVAVPVALDQPVTGSRIRVAVEDVDEVATTEWFSGAPIRMPVGIAELGIAPLTASAPAPSTPLSLGCRTDLVSVDGRPVPVSVDGTVGDLVARRALPIRPCAGSLELAAGEPEVTTTPGRATGIDVDGLVLQSAAGGAAPAAVGPVVNGQAGPDVRVAASTRTSFELEIPRAEPGTPFWLVLGQSASDGWELRVEGAEAGARTLVDGYANGWRLTPTAGTVTVWLEWAPQRGVWVALLASLLAALVCLALALRPAHGRLLASSGVANPPKRWVHNPGVGPKRAVAAVAALGVGAGAVIGPVPGLLTAAATALALWRPWGRWVLAAGAPGSLAVAAAYVIARQVRYRPGAAFEWPAEQHAVHEVAWMAIACLAALVAVDALRRPLTPAAPVFDIPDKDPQEPLKAT